MPTEWTLSPPSFADRLICYFFPLRLSVIRISVVWGVTEVVSWDVEKSQYCGGMGGPSGFVPSAMGSGEMET